MPPIVKVDPPRRIGSDFLFIDAIRDDLAVLVGMTTVNSGGPLPATFSKTDSPTSPAATPTRAACGMDGKVEDRPISLISAKTLSFLAFFGPFLL